MKKYVYIILTKTSTKIGRLIRLVTHYEYNHVSISLDKNLKEIYSFARYYKNAPLVGGFVVESIKRYENKNTQIKIFKIPVDIKTYVKMKRYIEIMKIYKKKYLYNTFSALFYVFKIPVDIKNSYTCLGFAKFILLKFNILDLTSKDFKSIKKIDKRLSNYKYFEGSYDDLHTKNDWGLDHYFYKKNFFVVVISTISHLTRLLYRFII